MSRTWDNWNRYQDNSRQPLHGCIQFMVKDGNTSAPIFDVDGTALDNPILTDEYGRTEHQVCINQDVTVYFYKYIGQGRWSDELDIDTSDVSKWSLQYTSEDMFNQSVSISSDAAMCVSNMSDLRGLAIDTVPTVNGIKVITLLGYNSLGDKEPINYVWNANSTAADDGGSVIKNDDLITGRWIMVQPTEHCDSRHFGVFPSNSNNMSDQTYQITKLFAYCNTKNIRPFFNGSADYRWFKYTNLNVSADVIDITDDSRFYDLGSNTITGEWNGNPKFVQKNTAIVAKNVKTSWTASHYTGYKNVIIDAYSDQKVWQDANVDIQISPLYGYSFTHCVLSENANIGSDNVNDVHNTFVNCKLNERMFITSGANVVNLAGKCTNCQIDMDDFRDNMWLYKQIRFTEDSNPFFDYRDMPNVGTPIDSYAANKVVADTVAISNLKNLVTNYTPLNTLNGQVTAFSLDNVTGYFNAPAGCSVILNNCSVKLKLEAGAAVTAKSSQIVLTEDNPGVTITLRDSTLTGDNTVHYICGGFTSYSSVIGVSIQSQNSVVKDSQINGQFTMLAEVGTSRTVSFQGQSVEVSHFIHGYFDNNIFNGKFKIDGQSAATIYSATHALVDSLVFQNNRSNLASLDAWEITRLGAMNSDALNAYTFMNNSGGFECSMTMTHVPVLKQNLGQSNGELLLTADLTADLTASIIGVWQSATNVSVTDTPSYADDFTKYFAKMRMFIIGQYDAVAELEFSVIDDPSDGTADMKLQANLPYTVAGANLTAFMRTPSTVQARLSTYSKYSSVDKSANFVIADLGKDPNSLTDEWQIRNFNLGHIGQPLGNDKTLELSLRIRQLDKKN